MKKFDASIPRRMFWSDELPNRNLCPLCHSRLESEYHTYLMAVRSKGGQESFMTGNKYGAFCSQCPVVVLDKDGFAKTVAETAGMAGLGRSQSGQFAVLGIVDFDAVPEEKAHLPLGDDDNPIPLVAFIRTAESTDLGKEGQQKKKPLVSKRKRIRIRR
jgi:hypothetical protein